MGKACIPSATKNATESEISYILMCWLFSRFLVDRVVMDEVVIDKVFDKL